MNEMDLEFTATAKPFAGVVLCCTGVGSDEKVFLLMYRILMSKSILVNQAQQMGAVFKADLRSDVTHMVVGNVSTPKYQVCPL